MTIHFICRGNTYRSRLAETYLKSKQLPNVEVISSGIEADKNLSGPINWYTQRLIQKNHLINFEKSDWQKTTQELLDKSDLIVFMNQDIYDFCKQNFRFENKKFEVWALEDLIRVFDVNEAVNKSEATFEEIKKKVEDLQDHLLQQSDKLALV